MYVFVIIEQILNYLITCLLVYLLKLYKNKINWIKQSGLTNDVSTFTTTH